MKLSPIATIRGRSGSEVGDGSSSSPVCPARTTTTPTTTRRLHKGPAQMARTKGLHHRHAVNLGIHRWNRVSTVLTSGGPTGDDTLRVTHRVASIRVRVPGWPRRRRTVGHDVTIQPRRGIVDHDLPEVTLRVAFAQLAAMFAEGRASYVPAQRRHLTPPSSFRWLSEVLRRVREAGSLRSGGRWSRPDCPPGRG
jgi:hypothetical protein